MSLNGLLNKAFKYLTDEGYRFSINTYLHLHDKMDDAEFSKRVFYYSMNRPLDLDNPKTFNEKLQWLKLYDRNPKYTTMVDKYEAKKYVADIIGEEYIIPTYGIWDSPDEIDFDNLPNQFVLKCTHNSGLGMCICKDKASLDIKKVKKELKKGLKQNYYYGNREWPYKNVKPRIIAEKYMVDESGTELKDYKVFCFNGEPELIEVDFERFIKHQRNFYTTDWQFIDMELLYPNSPSREFKKPDKLDEMLDKARILSKDIPHVRTDFYVINEKIYFGEITFFHESGCGKFTPEEWDEKLGDMIKLPNKN